MCTGLHYRIPKYMYFVSISQKYVKTSKRAEKSILNQEVNGKMQDGKQPMGTKCAPLVADLLLLLLFFFCYENNFMLCLSWDKQAEIIESFNSMSRYIHDLLNIVNTYSDVMVIQIYPSELQLNKANSSDTDTSFLYLHLTILDGLFFFLKFMISAMILNSMLLFFHS